MSDRSKTLLKLAAKAFVESSDPFSTDWLIENKVTADECFDLSSSIAFAIEWFLMDDLDDPALRAKLTRWAVQQFDVTP